jgi:DNA polymerase IV
LSSAILKLFSANYNSKQPLRLIGVKLSSFVQANMQLNMFDDTLEKVKLYESLDKIRNRFGNNSIKLGISLEDKKEIRKKE